MNSRLDHSVILPTFKKKPLFYGGWRPGPPDFVFTCHSGQCLSTQPAGDPAPANLCPFLTRDTFLKDISYSILVFLYVNLFETEINLNFSVFKINIDKAGERLSTILFYFCVQLLNDFINLCMGILDEAGCSLVHDVMAHWFGHVVVLRTSGSAVLMLCFFRELVPLCDKQFYM